MIEKKLATEGKEGLFWGSGGFAEQVTRGYVGIPLAAIKQFTKMCPLCNKREDVSAPNTFSKPGAQLPVNGLGGRMQLSLVDLRGRSDGEFQWILCAKDEWSRFVLLAPLRTASADEVALQLVLWFRLVGPPTILQGPSPKEEQFMVDVIRACQRRWPGLAIVNGRVPEFIFQTQGQRSVEAYILRSIDSSSRNDWASLLPEIQWNMNTMWKDELQACPYELVLGCRPRFNLVNKTGIACHSERVVSESEVEDYVTYSHSNSLLARTESLECQQTLPPPTRAPLPDTTTAEDTRGGTSSLPGGLETSSGRRSPSIPVKALAFSTALSRALWPAASPHDTAAQWAPTSLDPSAAEPRGGPGGSSSDGGGPGPGTALTATELYAAAFKQFQHPPPHTHTTTTPSSTS